MRYFLQLLHLELSKFYTKIYLKDLLSICDFELINSCAETVGLHVYAHKEFRN